MVGERRRKKTQRELYDVSNPDPLKKEEKKRRGCGGMSLLFAWDPE